MKPKKSTGITFIEIMLGITIMAMAIVPIVKVLHSQTYSTKADRSETEALQFACDLMDHILMKMDYDLAQIASPPWQIRQRGVTDLRYQILVKPVSWTNITSPKVKYHPPCESGVEKQDLAGDITEEDRDLRRLDKEIIDKLGLGAGLNNFDLCDIKVIVDWKPSGTSDSNWGKRPVILLSRKARL